jgi:hypothetical protein
MVAAADDGGGRRWDCCVARSIQQRLRFPMSLSALIQRINDLRPVPPAPIRPANPPNQRDLVIASLLRCPDVPAEDGAA